MPEPVLIFAVDTDASAATAHWLRPVLGAWPGPTAPSASPCLIDDLMRRIDGLDGEHGSDPTPLGGVVFVVLGQRRTTAQIDRLVEGLHRLHAPAVLLMERPEDWRLFQRHGVIFESVHTPAPTLAAMLYALQERQSTVRLLAREVQLAQRCQGGIRSEMDRLHEELHLAAAIQREITSSAVPNLPGLDIAVLYRPVNFVSGDVYSVRDLGEGRAAFFVADAVGHGVPAALLTMVLTSSLITSGTDASGKSSLLEPAEVLARLNRRLCSSCLGSGRFATAVYGVVDSRSRRVTVAGAGHPHPIVLSANGSREVETSGPLLGVFEDGQFDQISLDLDEHDTMLLYTDGLDAAFMEGERTSAARLRRDQWVARLARAMGESGTARLPRLLTELQHRLDLQAGSLHQCDDVTAVCISPKEAA